MKRLPLPSPSPSPEHLAALLHYMPYLALIPKEVIWSAVGAIVVTIFRHVYGLVIQNKIQKTQIEITTALREHQWRTENYIRIKFEKWETDSSNLMIEVVKMQKDLSTIARDTDMSMKSIEAQARQVHALSVRVNNIEGHK